MNRVMRNPAFCNAKTGAQINCWVITQLMSASIFAKYIHVRAKSVIVSYGCTAWLVSDLFENLKAGFLTTRLIQY